MATQIKNKRLLSALACEKVDRIPIWLMRQAGRYLPEYRKVRAEAKDFLTLCKTPELACTVALQPLERFPLDAAILFSDILTIPDAMGLGLHFLEGEGPCFNYPIRDMHAIKNLPIPDPEQELAYVPATVRLIKQALAGKVPLIGFAGSPWTLATYMTEGKASKTFSQSKALLYSDPKAMHLLLQKLTIATVSYLQAQIAAGCDVVMLFDSWGGILTTTAYEEFSLYYMHEIIRQLMMDDSSKDIPIILFTKGGNQWLEMIANTNCHAIGVDWTINIAQARERVGSHIALQGNLDPSILYASPEVIIQHAHDILTSLSNQPGHIFNLGHGIYPDVPIESVHILVETVHSFCINNTI